jgi:hypothetical protein
VSKVTPIGTTKGPGETQHEYTLITSDREGTTKAGEFVYYETEVDGEIRRVLGRITGRRPVRLFPNGFLADPEVHPTEVAAMIGYTDHDYELFEISVGVLGYYDEVLGDFVNPRLPPRAGTPIYVADSAMLAQILSKREMGQTGAAHVGSLLSRPAGEVPIAIDLRAVTSTHLAIIASTGAGKSYLAGVLVEDLMSPRNRAAVLIVDPHGEYDTLAQMQGLDAFASDDGYRPQVDVIRPDNVKVRVSSLTLGDLRYLLPDLSERMHYVLGRAYGLVGRKYGPKWTLRSSRMTISALPAPSSGDLTRVWRAHASSTTWRACRSTDSSAPVSAPCCNSTKSTSGNSRWSWPRSCGGQTEKRLVTEGDETYLPYPTFVLIEEAHNFAPASADLVSSQILKTILSEGRKFGVAVGLISQRPGKLDADVLSQCMTQFILRIVNPVDQARVAESVESVGRDLLRELPALSKGQAIITGAAVNTPVLCRVRRRITEHGAEDVDAPARWLEWFEEGQVDQRKRDSALPAEPETRGRSKLFKT